MFRASIVLMGVMALATASAPAAPAATAAPAPAAVQNQDPRLTRLEREVRHQLWLLPYYGVFDNLAFKVEPGGKVTLLGQVRKPTLKSDAERAVKEVEGVDTVDNQIEVLPLSPNDDRIRLRVYRAIYRNTGLERYAIQAVPPIHIIVKNGNVTLEGAVGSEMDKTLANIKARGVPGVFKVTNNLKVSST
jgi:hyperosmotically inducible periplasmic protein